MLFGKKKKNELHNGDIFLAKGIYLKKPELNNGNVVWNCFLRSLIVFLLVFGSVGGFLSAFGISYNMTLVVLFYLLLSAYFSFLYAAPKMIYRDLGYILFFGVFVGAIYVLRVHANSGFYVIVNSVLQRAQSFFDLSGVREYEVQIANDYLTVAIVAIFLGMVLIMILNIWMYTTMSIAWTILFTLPVLMIPLYMMLTPGPFYLIALCMGYLAVIVFKGNGHFLVFAWEKPFKIRGLKKDRITYTQDAGVFRQILLTFAFLFLGMVVLLELFVPSKRFTAMFKDDKLREETKEMIGNFILLGFEGMYNHYSSTGGMSGGKLGGVSSVRPDYQTDLVVSFAPYSNETVYLKGFTGGEYGENQWESLYDAGDNADDVEIFKEESLKKEAECLQEDMSSGTSHAAYGVIDVQNVGASPEYLYYPYYTMFEDYSIYANHSLMSSSQGIKLQQETSYHFYPKVVWENTLGQSRPGEIDVSQVDAVFLDVPDKNKEVIKAECEKIGLKSTMTENEIADTLQEYFQDNIPYTLKPGATPRDKDFINYFLTKNRKGYCAHFASAATLIFRQMGIPARYVEGYVIPYEAALASDLNEWKLYSDYYKGYSAVGESAVLDVEVTDAMAHAWVEIYIAGFGWKVVEVTPSSMETEEEDDFWSAFSDFLNNGSLDGGDNDNVKRTGLDLQKYLWVEYVILAMICMLMVVSMGRIGTRKWKRFRKCHQADKAEALVAYYADICEMIRVCDVSFAYCKSHMEQLIYMKSEYQVEMDCEMLCERLERISFSRQEIPKDQLSEIEDALREIRRAIWKWARWNQKMKLFLR